MVFNGDNGFTPLLVRTIIGVLLCVVLLLYGFMLQNALSAEDRSFAERFILVYIALCVLALGLVCGLVYGIHISCRKNSEVLLPLLTLSCFACCLLILAAVAVALIVLKLDFGRISTGIAVLPVWFFNVIFVGITAAILVYHGIHRADPLDVMVPGPHAALLCWSLILVALITAEIMVSVFADSENPAIPNTKLRWTAIFSPLIIAWCLVACCKCVYWCAWVGSWIAKWTNHMCKLLQEKKNADILLKERRLVIRRKLKHKETAEAIIATRFLRVKNARPASQLDAGVRFKQVSIGAGKVIIDVEATSPKAELPEAKIPLQSEASAIALAVEKIYYNLLRELTQATVGHRDILVELQKHLAKHPELCTVDKMQEFIEVAKVESEYRHILWGPREAKACGSVLREFLKAGVIHGVNTLPV